MLSVRLDVNAVEPAKWECSVIEHSVRKNLNIVEGRSSWTVSSYCKLWLHVEVRRLANMEGTQGRDSPALML